MESKWIPVSERKPGNARTVWIAVEGRVMRGYWNCGYDVFTADDGGKSYSDIVTHWQEIAEEPPAPPKRVRRVEGWVRRNDIHTHCHDCLMTCVPVTYEE